MRISRKTGILISSATVTAMTLGTAGTAAAVTADPPARRVAKAPAPDPTVVLNQLSNIGAVSKVVESLQAAMTDKRHPARVSRLVSQAKLQLDEIAATARAARPGGTTKPDKAHKPGKAVKHSASGQPTDSTSSTDALITKAVNQLEAELNAVVKAVEANDPTNILDAVNAALLSTVNVASAVLTASGLPPVSLPSLAQTPSLPSTATVKPAAPGTATAPAKPGTPSAPGAKPAATGAAAHN
ncbi:hypothetical protein ACFOSC_21975 [Streptantibioticus rubrisoli]|uniref:Secreted protein n=1 Tax=Streptantibioticus rubrisoli TaxID=1387313 RepID=A0ABT1P5H7_9ACTN|nr:hypothetical protein [Streptantibioticus rubrisoli]MCQ4040627.1 hypothetical protein [Streptantibioticus rubrisoli]